MPHLLIVTGFQLGYPLHAPLVRLVLAPQGSAKTHTDWRLQNVRKILDPAY